MIIFISKKPFFVFLLTNNRTFINLLEYFFIKMAFFSNNFFLHFLVLIFLFYIIIIIVFLFFLLFVIFFFLIWLFIIVYFYFRHGISLISSFNLIQRFHIIIDILFNISFSISVNRFFFNDNFLLCRSIFGGTC